MAIHSKLTQEYFFSDLYCIARNVLKGDVAENEKLDKSLITSRQQMENSMMPSGLYQTMTQQQLIDLVEFLHDKK
jgi:hypothetical protein